MIYDNIIVIGYGWITGEVVKYLHSNYSEYPIEYIEHEVHDFNTCLVYCEQNGIPHETIADKAALTDKLTDIDKRTLIISASNNYLIPAVILEKSEVRAINFHNAILPGFPGRNAPSWVIYEGERETGITWHYVTDKVDAGNIIIQKSIPIEPDIKAYELAGELMKLAYDAFVQCIGDVLSDSVCPVAQVVSPDRKMYLSKDVPGDGRFDITDNPDDIYRLLRSTDYGKSGIFPPVKTTVDGMDATVLRYRVVGADDVKEENGFLYLKMSDDRVLRIKYKVTE